MMDFVAIDFETANEDLASICQIGLVHFQDGKVVESYKKYIDPEDYFSEMNISIHGITEDFVDGSPTFPEIYKEIADFMNGKIIVSHTNFDRSAWNRTLLRYSLPDLDIEWLDSARVVRRTWEKYAWSGYGLANVARDLGIVFEHHDALEDATAAGLVLVRACEEKGMSIDDWIRRVERPIKVPRVDTPKPEPNEEGHLYGQTIVFTGSLTLPRKVAIVIASEAGCKVGSSVTKKTTLLVVGNQDIRVLMSGHRKSSKHLKAEKLIAAGQKIKVLQESDFMEITNTNNFERKEG